MLAAVTRSYSRSIFVTTFKYLPHPPRFCDTLVQAQDYRGEGRACSFFEIFRSCFPAFQELGKTLLRRQSANTSEDREKIGNVFHRFSRLKPRVVQGKFEIGGISVIHFPKYSDRCDG